MMSSAAVMPILYIESLQKSKIERDTKNAAKVDFLMSLSQQRWRCRAVKHVIRDLS